MACADRRDQTDPRDPLWAHLRRRMETWALDRTQAR